MAEDEIIKKHTKAAYEVLKKPGLNWQHKLREILLEIIIIVFAVNISIWFHNWSERQKDHREEREFLTSLKNDLQDDRKEMTDDKNNFIEALQGVVYFQKAGAGLPLNMDSLNKYQWIFFAGAQINPRIGRYEALKGSGKLDIVENRELLKNITDLYEKNFPLITRQNQTFNALRENYVTPFIEDHLKLNMEGDGTNWQDLLREPKMRLLVFQINGLGNNIQAYSDGIAKINQILAQIDDALK